VILSIFFLGREFVFMVHPHPHSAERFSFHAAHVYNSLFCFLPPFQIRTPLPPYRGPLLCFYFVEFFPFPFVFMSTFAPLRSFSPCLSLQFHSVRLHLQARFLLLFHPLASSAPGLLTHHITFFFPPQSQTRCTWLPGRFFPPTRLS